jgi:hypothetical protein
VNIAFNVPNAIGEGAAPCASDFLLLKPPVRKLDFVGEEHTASHDVDKLELGLDSPKTLLSLCSVRLALDDFNAEEVIRIALKTFITIGRYLVLPISLCNGRANIVRMKTAVSRNVVEPDDSAILNVIWT